MKVTFKPLHNFTDNSSHKQNKITLFSTDAKDLETCLLKKHTDLILYILTRLNESHTKNNIQRNNLYENLDSIIVEQGLLRTKNHHIPYPKQFIQKFRGLSLSQEHLAWCSELESRSLKYGTTQQVQFTKLLCYPYTAQRSTKKTPYLSDVNVIFNLQDQNVYDFYTSLFSSPGVEQAFLDYHQFVIKQTLINNPNLIDYDRKIYEKTLFLTWVQVKGQGRTHLNKYNVKKPDWLTPITERHLHLAIVLSLVKKNYLAKCYLNPEDLSLIRLITRKCFHQVLDS